MLWPAGCLSAVYRELDLPPWHMGSAHHHIPPSGSTPAQNPRTSVLSNYCSYGDRVKSAARVVVPAVPERTSLALIMHLFRDHSNSNNAGLSADIQKSRLVESTGGVT